MSGRMSFNSVAYDVDGEAVCVFAGGTVAPCTVQIVGPTGYPINLSLDNARHLAAHLLDAAAFKPTIEPRAGGTTQWRCDSPVRTIRAYDPSTGYAWLDGGKPGTEYGGRGQVVHLKDGGWTVLS